MVFYITYADMDAEGWRWTVFDADGERVYPRLGSPHHNLNSIVLKEARDTLNRSPLSYHKIRLEGLSPIEAARPILERAE